MAVSRLCQLRRQWRRVHLVTIKLAEFVHHLIWLFSVQPVAFGARCKKWGNSFGDNNRVWICLKSLTLLAKNMPISWSVKHISSNEMMPFNMVYLERLSKLLNTWEQEQISQYGISLLLRRLRRILMCQMLSNIMGRRRHSESSDRDFFCHGSFATSCAQFVTNVNG